MPDFFLARFAIVHENGHADHGTGHTPTNDPGRFRLRKSPIWTKFRRETQESISWAKATGCSDAEVQPRNEVDTDRDNKLYVLDI